MAGHGWACRLPWMETGSTSPLSSVMALSDLDEVRTLRAAYRTPALTHGTSRRRPPSQKVWRTMVEARQGFMFLERWVVGICLAG